MVQTELDVCNLAISRVGGEPIEEIGEDTPLGAFCQNAYGQKRDWLLGKHRWSFATRIALLARRSETPPDCPLPYAFDLPADLIGSVQAYRDRADITQACSVRALQVDGYVAACGSVVWIEYTARKPEAAWPVWFVELVKTAFAADIAGVKQNRTLANDLISLAFGDPREDGDGGLLLQAKVEDARNAPPRQAFSPWDDGVLVGARAGGPGSGFGWNGQFVDFG